MDNNENFNRIKEQLKNRKCPYCNTSIKHYLFASLMIPSEGTAQEAAYVSNANNSSYVIYPFGFNSWITLMRITLTSTCQCGNISLWNYDVDTLKVLLSKEMENDRYIIEHFYHKDNLNELLNNTNNEKYKSIFNDLYKASLPNKDNK